MIDAADRRLYARIGFALFAAAILCITVAAILGAAVQTFRYISGF